VGSALPLPPSLEWVIFRFGYIRGLGRGVWGLGFGVWLLGSKVLKGLNAGTSTLGLRVGGLGLGFEGFGVGIPIKGRWRTVQPNGIMALTKSSRALLNSYGNKWDVFNESCAWNGVRTGSWTGPPRGKRAPRIGISSTVFGVRA